MTDVESHSRNAIRFIRHERSFFSEAGWSRCVGRISRGGTSGCYNCLLPNEAIETFEVNSGAKADRLPIVASSDEAKKEVIEPVKVASSQVQAEKAPITSWHWHVGSNKITRK